jgi:hypothetical protein
MQRIFLALALADGALLTTCYVHALLGSTAHAWLGLVATLATLFVHALAVGFSRRSVVQVEKIARAGRMPAWVVAQARKHARKTSWLALWGVMLLVVAALLDLISGASLWRLAAFSVALTFNLGVFGLEFLLLLIQKRLLRAVRMRARQQQSAVQIVAPAGVGARS